VAEQVVGQRRKDAAHRVIALQAGLELVLFGAHLAHHVLDHTLVLAAQLGQLGQLLAQAGKAGFEQAAHAQADIAEFTFGIVANDVLLGRDQFIGKRRLQHGQAALSSSAGRH
jgi:hypothetical protein